MPFLDEVEEVGEDEKVGRLSVARLNTHISRSCMPCITACTDCLRGVCCRRCGGNSDGETPRGTSHATSEDVNALKPPDTDDSMSVNTSDPTVDVLADLNDTGGQGLTFSRHRRRGSDLEITLGSGGVLTPASSMANIAAFAEAAEKLKHSANQSNGLGNGSANVSANGLASVQEIPSALTGGQSTKNALGEVGGAAPDLAAAVAVAVKRDFEEQVAVWSRDVRGRFLAHLKVLYWESLEEGRATKEVVETLVECADIALDELDEPLCDWEALKTRVLGKAQKGSSLWKRLYRALPGPLRESVKWTRQWVLHSGAVGAGGSRRRALVAAALFHDARREANHAIFGHLDGEGMGVDDSNHGKEKDADKEKTSKDVKSADINDVSLLYDSDEGVDDGRDPARVAAQRVRLEATKDADAAKSYLRAARTNEPELAAAVKSEETARRLLATAERSARGYVQSGLLTEAEAAELLAGVSQAQRRLRLDPPEPVTRDPRDLMRMSPLLDPTHSARVRDLGLVDRLTRDAPSMLVRRFPGDVVDATSLAPNGGLLLLARGVVDVEWSKPIGEGGGGGSTAPLRVGASSTSYGWAIGAADLLTPGAARYKMRAVSTVTAFVLPPDLVKMILDDTRNSASTETIGGRRRVSLDSSKKEVPSEKLQTTNSNGTADALWRAAFGLLAATALRDDLQLAEVSHRTIRQAATKSKISVKHVGARVGPFPSRSDQKNHPPKELVVLLSGEVYDETEGTLVGPCVLVPTNADSLTFAQSDPERFASFNKLALRMGMSSDGGSVISPEKKTKRVGSLDGGRNVSFPEISATVGSPMVVNEKAAILRVPLMRSNDSGGYGSGNVNRLDHGTGSGSFGAQNVPGISSPPKVTSYLPGLEGSGWGKFGKNPLELSRAADLRQELLGGSVDKAERRRISVNVGSLNLANQRIRESEGGEDQAQREFSRFLSEARDGNKPSKRDTTGSDQRKDDDDFMNDTGDSTDFSSRHGSGGDLRSLAEGVPFEDPYGRTSEGSDVYQSSLDKTTAHILARNIKRDIFAPRRTSLDARSKAVSAEAASMAGSIMADRAFQPGASSTQSARRANVTGPRASVAGLFRRADGPGMSNAKATDTFPPRQGQGNQPGSPNDTFPPRPAGGAKKTSARRVSIGAALFKATMGGSTSEDTFPPRRGIGGRTAQKPKVVEWTHDISESDEEEATIQF